MAEALHDTGLHTTGGSVRAFWELGGSATVPVLQKLREVLYMVKTIKFLLFAFLLYFSIIYVFINIPITGRNTCIR